MSSEFIGYSQKRASRIFNNILIDDYIVKRNQHPPERKSCRNFSAGWLFCIVWILPNVLISAVIAYIYRLQTTFVLTNVYSPNYFRKFNLSRLMQRTEFFCWHSSVCMEITNDIIFSWNYIYIYLIYLYIIYYVVILALGIRSIFSHLYLFNIFIYYVVILALGIRKPIIWPNNSRKLYENEKKGSERGTCPVWPQNPSVR